MVKGEWWVVVLVLVSVSMVVMVMVVVVVVMMVVVAFVLAVVGLVHGVPSSFGGCIVCVHILLGK